MKQSDLTKEDRSALIQLHQNKAGDEPRKRNANGQFVPIDSPLRKRDYDAQRLRRSGRKGIAIQRRFRILARDGFKCRYCGTPSSEAKLNIDHIIPIAKGGLNADSNLITSCFDCNSGKSDVDISKLTQEIPDIANAPGEEIDPETGLYVRHIKRAEFYNRPEYQASVQWAFSRFSHGGLGIKGRSRERMRLMFKLASEGKTRPEIAKLLGVTPANVNKQWRRFEILVSQHYELDNRIAPIRLQIKRHKVYRIRPAEGWLPEWLNENSPPMDARELS